MPCALPFPSLHTLNIQCSYRVEDERFKKQDLKQQSAAVIYLTYSLKRVVFMARTALKESKFSANHPSSSILKINYIHSILKASTSFSLVPGKHISQPVSARTNSACLPVWTNLEQRPGQRSNNQSAPHIQFLSLLLIIILLRFPFCRVS